jgi:signal transduction histidine kinase
MRERVEGVGGRLERRDEEGTTLAIVLPRRPEAVVRPLRLDGLAAESGR